VGDGECVVRVEQRLGAVGEEDGERGESRVADKLWERRRAVGDGLVEADGVAAAAHAAMRPYERVLGRLRQIVEGLERSREVMFGRGSVEEVPLLPIAVLGMDEWGALIRVAVGLSLLFFLARFESELDFGTGWRGGGDGAGAYAGVSWRGTRLECSDVAIRGSASPLLRSPSTTL
jgi:hypothetical protein